MNENIRDPVSQLFGAYRRKVLAFLLGRPAEAHHVREIARRSGVPVGSVHRELRTLAAAGILRRTEAGRQVRYQAERASPLFAPLAAIVGGLGGHPIAAEEAAGVAEAPAAYPRPRSPRCFVIGGSNGSGKTTFAREYLPKEAGTVHFVNADLIAGGLSPLEPGLAAMESGRMVLRELDRLANAREDFAFESTLSGLAYVARLKHWREQGYFIKIVFLRIDSVALALKRIAARVRQGGHDVPRPDVIRRFSRSLKNFESRYKSLADAWELYDNSGPQPRLLETGP